jgi:hypothetical protein
MNERRFNSVMPRVNETWAAKVLNMQINPQRGPDLIDDKKAVEIKSKILYPNGRYTHKCWKVLGHQLNYNINFPDIYWGLVFYKTNTEVADIKKNDLGNLEKIVDYRELYLVRWDWMNQFPIYHHHGKTQLSEWDNDIIFLKFVLIPKVISAQEVKDGKIFFTEGVDSYKFEINKGASHQNTYKDIPF